MKAVIALFYFSFIIVFSSMAAYAWSNRYDKGYAGREMVKPRSDAASGAEARSEEAPAKIFVYST